MGQMNEIKILVRTQNSAKAGMQEIDKDLEVFAKESSEKFSKNFSDNITKNLSTQLTQKLQTVSTQAQEGARRAGDTLGNTIGERVTSRINERISRDVVNRMDSGNGGSGRERVNVNVNDRNRDRVHVDVDVDKQSFFSKLASFGKEAGAKFGGFFKDGFGSVASTLFSGDVISMFLKGVSVAGIAAVLAPVLGAGITAAFGLVLGGGAIALGLAGAFRDPRIQLAAKEMLDRVKVLFDKFSAPFKGVLEDFIVGKDKGGGGGLLGVLKQITPMIEHLGQVLAPSAGRLGQGIIGMLQNALPGILRAIEKSTPLINVLADKLPGIGDAIGKFFDHIGNGAPQAALFLGDFLEGVEKIIIILGKLIEFLTVLYAGAHNTFVGIVSFVGDVIDAIKDLRRGFTSTFNWLINLAGQFLHAAVLAFGWMPGIGPKLRAAEAQFRTFKNNVNNQLGGITRSILVSVRFNVVGLAGARAAVQVAQILHNMGYQGGGVTGHAAEGGPRNGMVWVGENGPELVDLAPGSTVHSAGDSQRLAGQSNGRGMSGTLRLSVDRNTERGIIDALFSMFRAEIRDNFGGDVQDALGT